MKITASVGIDPGKKGGIARVILKDGIIHSWTFAPLAQDSTALKAQVECFALGADLCTVEQVGQFNASRNHRIAWEFGKSVGQLHAILNLCDIDFDLMCPQTWHRLIGRKNFAGEGKEQSVNCAMAYFTDEMFLAPRGRKPHDGIVEACLIALAGTLKKDSENGRKAKKSTR